jgi:hypothetical protein
MLVFISQLLLRTWDAIPECNKRCALLHSHHAVQLEPNLDPCLNSGKLRLLPMHQSTGGMDIGYYFKGDVE